ncbi:MAG: hypothetical protein HC851_15715, partial [Acaryochloris sp. RU_4_1]|nr:hypothetical protein [Acaryochloris sp. RU_4_1]
SLTECMIPSAFVLLDTMPLTPNGKVDRRALPIPNKAEFGLDRPFSAPQTVAEEVIANIWKQILNIERVGIHDNFFNLGGHSLLATRVISRLQNDFQADELPLRCLFESPTVAGLVNELTRIWGDRQTVEQIAEVLKSMESLSAADIDQMLLAPQIT